MAGGIVKPWICISRLGSLGDDLIASSVFPLLKKQGYMLEVMATPPSHVVFENNPYIDKLTVLKDEDLPKTNVEWHSYFVKRAKEYDKFFHLSHSIESRLAFFPDNAGFLWPPEFRRKQCDVSYLAFTHDLCGVEHDYAPEFFPTEEENDFAQRLKIKAAPLGQPVIGWVIAGSRIDKLHPHSTLIIARLIKELGVSVIMFGALNEKEHSAAKTIMEHVILNNGSAQGLWLAMSKDDKGQQVELPVRKSMALAQHCDLVISPDTGIAWSVAMCPMPKIIMLGHASPKNVTTGWTNTITLHADQKRVPCHPCHILHNEPATCTPNKQNNGAACISDIGVEKVIRTARAALSQNATSRATLGEKPLGVEANAGL